MLSAIYIKGFKTFARPVRMPLEGGITAIVGPNGSGKSNITDAVLFALGEQSPGVLRAGAMGDLIFSGSESLPAASAAEVTLVFDNASGEISLPYEEVSITRRISRVGETEYRINGSRSRLADVRAVAGEAGLGRHSILRQGSVDAIVAGGAAACRLALEEAAGLGVYRRRRLSASRRLERADDQLEKSRQLETELATQLRRIQTEAEAARRYREIESRYRELSLAHLYRVANRELSDLRERLRAGRSRVDRLDETERGLRDEGEKIEQRLRDISRRANETERRAEALEDAAEDLRSENLRADRALLRLDSGADREGERRLVLRRLQEELRRTSESLEQLRGRAGSLEPDVIKARESAEEKARAAQVAARKSSGSERERSRLAAELDRLRARLAGLDPAGPTPDVPEEDLARLRRAIEELRGLREHRSGDRVRRLAEEVSESLGRAEARFEEVSHRRGGLAAAVGRSESRVRSLRAAAPAGDATRLYEVIRARPGYEAAVEAALGEHGAGVLAENLDKGMLMLSEADPVALRLDAEDVKPDGHAPGTPLSECVDVLDGRYTGAVERLLGGIFVVDSPNDGANLNGHVAVTTDGLRLTRTSVSRRPGPGNFEREARLGAELEILDALKNGPGGTLYDARGTIQSASERLTAVSQTANALRGLSERARRARSALVTEAVRRLGAAETSRRKKLDRQRQAGELAGSISSADRELSEAEKSARSDREAAAAATAAAESARAAAQDSDRRLRSLRAAISDGKKREAAFRRRLEKATSSAPDTVSPRDLAKRAADLSAALLSAVRERRNGLRQTRAGLSEAQGRVSEERSQLSRRAVETAGELATARAEAARFSEEVARAEADAAASLEEIQTEWGSTLEAARLQAERHPEETDAERQKLARQLKRFGDVNLLALSQEQELRERHEFVAAQRADAEEATAELNRIIHSVDREIEVRFSQTFGRVREAFGEIVPRMLQGASGILELSEEGVEIGLRLGRKGWRPLRVLSGGERALLALSFLFSIFLSRPMGGSGAFCILDEAEAALDDVNLARFLSVVDSHRSGGQYLLVTHQKRTMAAADVLYGVVQDASGATTVVSKRLQGEREVAHGALLA
ncbi:chromosome segregation protein SMC [Rubrobacter tropicus]|uniref:Chromosome segregation protein SMC n=1 Tax=Rubrobacter tropicus TaxID=2653851 RepID=A0A6G8Q947_9ACTN|nr:chromosome segregation protein SMC [Rubrobacter tropicus]QIN82948.1 chromosome segregation protein SMC [Rubrobacter tropicus]